eukprot:SM000026S08855  [mRNA]  locus=s26:145607:147344:+ [translate_table: standard]
MGSFMGHVIPGTLFLAVGLWHIVCSIHGFAVQPKAFRARVWHPLPGRLKYLELYVITVGAFVDAFFVELLMGTHYRPIRHGTIAPGELNNFEHAAMLLMFFLLGATALIHEKTSLLSLPDGFLHLAAALAFTAEFLLFYFHSTSHAGLEGRYHELLALLIALCVLFALLSALHPTSFLVDLGGAMAVTLQGLWFYQTALTLYGSMIPKGCRTLPSSDVECTSPAAEERGQSLANLLFSAHVMSVLVGVILVYSITLRWWGHANIWNITYEPKYEVHGKEEDLFLDSAAPENELELPVSMPSERKSLRPSRSGLGNLY